MEEKVILVSEMYDEKDCYILSMKNKNREKIKFYEIGPYHIIKKLGKGASAEVFFSFYP